MPASGGFLLAILAISLWSGAGSAQYRVDGVAALVEDEVILRSDVDLRARLHLAGEGAVVRSTLPSDLLAASLEELVGEVLLAREARQRDLPAPTPQVIRRELQRLEAMAGGRERAAEVLASVGAGPDELEEAAVRRARAGIFLEAQLRDDSRVTDAQVTQVYESGEHPFVGQDLESAREGLRVWIVRRRVASALEQWVRTLKSR
ncbi:MAG: hypothetical protein AAF645_30425, partial [Myxococcota bacterium]